MEFKRIASVFLALALALSALPLAALADGASPTPITVVSQSYENLEENATLSQAYTSKGALKTGLPKITDGAAGYTGGKVADFDFSSVEWPLAEPNYPIGFVYTNTPNKSDTLPYVPGPEDDYTLSFSIYNESGYDGDYLWFCLYDERDGRENEGLKIPTGEFSAGVWYDVEIKVTAGEVTATKTIRGGEATNFSLSLANGIGSGRTNQFCFTFYPQSTSATDTPERRAAHFQLDNISLVAIDREPELEEEPVVTGSPITNIVLQLGRTESELNFTFFTTSEQTAKIRFAKTSELVGGALPDSAAEVSALRTDSKKAGYFGNKATITGLLPSTTYTYVIISGENSTAPKTFKTASATDFSFVFMGDPQIGRGYGSNTANNVACIEDDWAAFEKTLNQMASSSEFAGSDFILSAGDQVNGMLDYEGNELQWDAYSNHDVLLEMPTVTLLGNHDDKGGSVYQYHTNQPNMLTKENGGYYGATYDTIGGVRVMKSADYYFVFNSVLFIALNTNNFYATNGSDAATARDKAAAEEHGEFIAKVMELTANEEISWTIVLMHHSPYGSSYHGNYTESNGAYARTEQYAFENMRKFLLPVLYENGVDLVFSGHDHTYTRTHVIKPATDESGNYNGESIITPYEDGSYLYADGTTTPSFVDWTDANGVVHTDKKVSSKPVKVTNPDGIVYITGATSTGSQVNPATYEHPCAAVIGAANTRQLSRVFITEDEIKIITYNLGTETSENITVVDEFTIAKAATPPEETPDEEGAIEKIRGELEKIASDLDELYGMLEDKANADEILAAIGVLSDKISALEAVADDYESADLSLLGKLRAEITAQRSELNAIIEAMDKSAQIDALESELEALNGELATQKTLTAVSLAVASVSLLCAILAAALLIVRKKRI